MRKTLGAIVWVIFCAFLFSHFRNDDLSQDPLGLFLDPLAGVILTFGVAFLAYFLTIWLVGCLLGLVGKVSPGFTLDRRIQIEHAIRIRVSAIFFLIGTFTLVWLLSRRAIIYLHWRPAVAIIYAILSIPISVALIMFVGNLFEPGARRKPRVLFSRWLGSLKILSREPIFLSNAAARRACGNKGSTGIFDRHTYWTEAEIPIIEDFAAAKTKAENCAGQLLGISLDTLPPLHFIRFEHEASLRRFFRGFNFQFPPLVIPFGFHIKRMKSVFAREIFNAVLIEQCGVLALCLMQRLLAARFGKVPPWVLVSLSEYTIADMVTSAPDQQLRFIHAAMRRNVHYKDLSLLLVQQTEYTSLVRESSIHEKGLRLSAFHVQCGLFLNHLLHLSPDATRDFLKGALADKQDLPRWFRYCFSLDLEPEMNGWLEKIGNLAPEPIQPAPPHVQSHLDSVSIPRLLNPATPLADQYYVIRLISRIGYAWHANALIDVMRKRDKQLLMETQMALEVISGELHESPDAWQQWFDSLEPRISGRT